MNLRTIRNENKGNICNWILGKLGRYKKKWLSGYISWGKIGPAERLENKRNENV